jgi:hypothetical protein
MKRAAKPEIIFAACCRNLLFNVNLSEQLKWAPIARQLHGAEQTELHQNSPTDSYGEDFVYCPSHHGRASHPKSRLQRILGDD